MYSIYILLIIMVLLFMEPLLYVRYCTKYITHVILLNSLIVLGVKRQRWNQNWGLLAINSVFFPLYRIVYRLLFIIWKDLWYHVYVFIFCPFFFFITVLIISYSRLRRSHSPQLSFFQNLFLSTSLSKRWLRGKSSNEIFFEWRN